MNISGVFSPLPARAVCGKTPENKTTSISIDSLKRSIFNTVSFALCFWTRQIWRIINKIKTVSWNSKYCFFFFPQNDSTSDSNSAGGGEGQPPSDRASEEEEQKKEDKEAAASPIVASIPVLANATEVTGTVKEEEDEKKRKSVVNTLKIKFDGLSVNGTKDSKLNKLEVDIVMITYWTTG